MDELIRKIIDISWTSYKNKVASGLFTPENEKMMQLQFAQTFQTISPLFEYNRNESIKILLEQAVNIDREPKKRIIDLVISHSLDSTVTYYPIELKCFRKHTRDNLNNLRGAQNLGMYDYWVDIENIEQYSKIANYGFGTHLVLTDDEYYVTGKHQGDQVKVYSTNKNKINVTGLLEHKIANRQGKIELTGNYSMTTWEKIGDYYFIRQENNNAT